MGQDLAAEKAKLRQEVRTRLDKISAKERELLSVQACSLLAGQQKWQKATSVLLYFPLLSEIDVWPLAEKALSAGKLLALPQYDAKAEAYNARELKDLRKDLEIGRYGISEPKQGCAEIALNRLDLILVPGVAFDMQGRRLGRGKGFYDRIVGAVHGTTCGVAFDEQIVDRVPVGPLDSDVNCILTPTRWIEP